MNSQLNSSIGVKFLLATLLSLAFLLGACESKDSADKASLPSTDKAVKAADAASKPKPKDSAAKEEPEPTPEPSTISSEFTGKTEANRKAMVMARIPGTIEEVLVEEGQIVEVDQPLLVVDTSDYELGVKQAKAAIAVARAQKQALETEWRRIKELTEGGALPESQFDQLDGQLDVAKAGINQAQVGLQKARKAIKDAAVLAPFKAVITGKMATKGGLAAPGAPLFNLEELDPIKVRIQVPESALRQAEVGECLEISFPSIDESRFALIAKKIPSINGQNLTFPVIASLPNPGYTLPSGLFATARLVPRSRCTEEVNSQ